MQEGTIFEQAVRDGDAATVARMLHVLPGLARSRGEGAVDPIALAATHGRLEVLRLLIEVGGLPQAEAAASPPEHAADPAPCDQAGRTAAEAGNAEVAQRPRTAPEAKRIMW